ncbi:MAG: dUTP diphosphatase [Synechococcus sp.]|nr:dUTP diphosphatase [Synechococcus sp.]
MHLRLLKLHPDAIIPQYQHGGDSGMDLHAIAPVAIAPHKTALIRTGLAAEIPLGTELQIRPRSGLALKQSVTVLNSPGTIDANYRGEIGVILINHSDRPFQVEVGMRIAQMVMVPVMRPEITVVDKISETTRGTGGFGSTGS